MAATDQDKGSILPGKRIIILSDGTGNSASAVFKTNVWRLYQALDLSEQPEGGASRQIAYYDDGVGTSSFRPLALLGGAFGVGLKRNVLDLYKFICRNYQPGDRIYAFGFSRGAFTIRVTVGLLALEGVLRGTSEEALGRHAADAYRELRRCFQRAGGLVTFFRAVRDLFLTWKRRIQRHALYGQVRKTNLPVDAIAFVGVWDTVAAYGLPIAELTRGVDLWVWPLSMPDYVLSPKVQAARHALALDDERDTFHPLVWDEVAEEQMMKAGDVQPGRLQQVWFSGMHSDVGGGYPEDAVALVPLLWMLREAETCGLRFKPDAVKDVEQGANAFAPLHDSRGGLAAYYRLQPRKLSAKLHPPDPTTLLMQDPDPQRHGLLKSVTIHQSVFDRITKGIDNAAPIVLPGEYRVLGWDGTIGSGPEGAPGDRAARQERVWNEVWKRRVNYFLIVGVSLFLALFPFLLDDEVSTCIGPECLAVPLISALGWFLPEFAEIWIEGFSAMPGVFLLGALALFLLMRRSKALEKRAHDHMRALWVESLAAPLGGAGPEPAPARPPDDWIYGLRSSRLYQRGLQLLKWKIVPGIFGLTLLAGIFVAVVTVVLRIGIEATSLVPAACGSTAAELPTGPPFATSALCWPTGYPVEKGKRYQVTMDIGEAWIDGSIETSPRGFHRDRFPFRWRYSALVLRRSLLDRWFQPMATIVPAGFGVNHTQALAMRWTEGDTFAAEFTASQNGALFVFVNDAVVPFPGARDRFYRNNQGTADVRVRVLPPEEPD